MSPIRRLALALARHGAAVMPRADRDWGRAMAAEIGHIDGDARALAWGAGCVWAGYCVRGASMNRTVLILARAGLAGVVALLALGNLLPAVMALGYKTGNLGLAASMDGVVAADDYARFAPMMDAVTPEMLGLWFGFGLAFLAAAAALLAGWRAAAWLLGGAMALQALAGFIQRGDAALQAARQATLSAAELHSNDIAGTVFYLALLGGAAWLARPRRGPGVV